MDRGKVFYIEKGYEAPVEILSSGHKSIIVMVGDMMIRLFETQPEIDDPKDLKGIVLIDELEAHLHPKWQRAFPQLLSEAFPNIQFIASTHSILPFMGAPAGSTYLKVKRTEAEGTTLEKLHLDLSNLLPNTLLSSPLFDLASLTSQQNQKLTEL